MSVLSVGSPDKFQYASEFFPWQHTRHACYNPELKAAYLLQQEDNSSEADNGIIIIAKVTTKSLSSARAGHKYNFRVKSPSNIDSIDPLGGRIGVFYNAAMPSVETIYAAISYTYDGMQPTANDVTIMQITFNNDVTQCDSDGTCSEFIYTPDKGKILALAPLSATSCNFLILNQPFEIEAAKLVLLTVDFTTGEYTKLIQQIEIEYAKNFFATPFYNSGGNFEDFYVVVTHKIENTYEDVALLMTIIDDSKRLTAFFVADEDELSITQQTDYTDTVITTTDVSASSFSVGRTNMGDKQSDDSFVRFNGVWPHTIISFEAQDRERQTFLNCAPNISPKLVYKLTYKVGQFLYAVFPTVNDIEENYTATRFDVVSYNYKDESSNLPPA